MTLETRIQNSPEEAITSSKQERWVQQIASALAWIEDLGYVHGDLRPANIFLDAKEEIRIGDFDATVKKGEQLLVASEPFCRLNENYETPLAGPLSEQFALASCIYTIRFGHKPFPGLEPHVRVKQLIMGVFPPTASDAFLGGLIHECWHGRHDSIRTVEQNIRSLLGKCRTAGEAVVVYAEEAVENEISSLRAECDEFLAQEHLLTSLD
jgi:serine/threonine protein kinase